VAVPTGATSVKYAAAYYTGDGADPGDPIIDITVKYETQLPTDATNPVLRQLLDDALSAAFLAFAAVVEGEHPDVPGGVSRSYTGSIAGDPWPTA
jgi:hypothetical protein